METYRYYPPTVRPQVVPYQIIEDGRGECRHELLGNDWCERIMVRDGIVFLVSITMPPVLQLLSE